jgi:hypothetical protein
MGRGVISSYAVAIPASCNDSVVIQLFAAFQMIASQGVLHDYC